MDTEEDIVKSLIGSSTVKRRAAAKAALKIKGEFCAALTQGLQLELNSKSWQTKVELVKSLGELRCRGSEAILRGIVFSREGSEYDMVKMKAAKALVQVSRANLADCKTVWEILNAGGQSIMEGAMEALGYDRMVFDAETCRSLIVRCWDLGSERSRGYSDPRYGLAAACAGWDKELTRDFLQHCLKADDVPLCYVAEKSLQGKYVRLR